ncbi:MAG: hypothetical protein C0462_09590 [Alcanivorax sp.]|nr:hypothetical protein [Alcanivorax sp.]
MNVMQAPLQTWVQAREDGEDPRYSDAFSALRGEVEKLSGNDFERISELGETVLTEQALDLRVLAYVSLARTYLQGASGLHDAVLAWCWVLESRWEQCFPQRDNARRAAIEWLTNERFPVFLARNSHDGEVVSALTEALSRLHALIEQRLGEPVRLKAIHKWLEDNAAPTPSAPAEPDSAENEDAQTSPPRFAQADTGARSPTHQAPASGAIDNDKAEQKALRDLLAWYRAEQRFLELVSLGRVMRWSDLVPPPADNGSTRVPPPRPASLNAVSVALDRQQWSEALLAAERAFLEPGGQFCFQIQHWAHQAAKGLGLRQVCARIEQDTAALLAHHRDLLRLRFADGEPFVSGNAANWIETLMAPADSGSGADNDRWPTLGREAEARVADQGLAAGLAFLDEQPAHSDRERVELDLLRAGLALTQGRADLALPLLESVNERIAARDIGRWEPALALRAWRLLQQALRAGEENEAQRQRLDDISQLISRTDITAAAAML